MKKLEQNCTKYGTHWYFKLISSYSGGRDISICNPDNWLERPCSINTNNWFFLSIGQGKVSPLFTLITVFIKWGIDSKNFWRYQEVYLQHYSILFNFLFLIICPLIFPKRITIENGMKDGKKERASRQKAFFFNLIHLFHLRRTNGPADGPTVF